MKVGAEVSMGMEGQYVTQQYLLSCLEECHVSERA